MMDCKFSFILPVYETEKYLKKCLDSICGQTYSDIEIILIHDETGDRSGVICDEYAAKDQRIYVVHRPKGDVSTARNMGMDRATGDYIIFVDSDDWISEDCCQKMKEALDRAGSDIDIVLTDWFVELFGERQITNCMFQDNGKIFQGEEGKRELLKYCLAGANLKDPDCSAGEAGVVWAKAYRRECVNEVRFVGEKSEDVLFNLYAIQNSQKILYINDKTYHYRRNLESACLRYDARRVEEYNKFYERCSIFFEQYDYDHSLEEALYIRIVGHIIADINGSIAHPMRKIGFRIQKQQIRKLLSMPYHQKALAYYRENYKKNKCLFSTKYKIVCFLLFMKCYGLILLLSKFQNKRRTLTTALAFRKKNW